MKTLRSLWRAILSTPLPRDLGEWLLIAGFALAAAVLWELVR